MNTRDTSSLPPVALLAGGKATRLMPLTESVPKSMLEIAGKPFISWQLELLKSKGISDVVICAGHHGGQVQEFVDDGKRFGLHVQYSFDGKEPLGTGGSIKKALPLLGDVFFVLYGDSYLNADFRAVYRYFSGHRKKGLMTVFRNEGRWDTSNIVFKDGSLITYSKKERTPEMRYIDYGLSLLKKEIFDTIDGSRACDLSDILAEAVANGDILGCEMKERFYEIGSFRGLEETKDYLLRQAGEHP